MKFAEIKNGIVRDVIIADKKPKDKTEKIEKVERIDQSNYKILSGKTTIKTEYVEIKNKKVGIGFEYKNKNFIPPKPPNEIKDTDGNIIRIEWELKNNRWVSSEPYPEMKL